MGKIGTNDPRNQYNAAMGRSCWYHLRYIDPKNSHSLVSRENKLIGGPDFYIGGAEHAVLHLLYARFWHRFLYDEGVLTNLEPYKNFFIKGSYSEDGNKMSKSIGNVVNPDVVIGTYGADSLRLFEMFLGPLEAVKPWRKKALKAFIDFFARYIVNVTMLPNIVMEKKPIRRPIGYYTRQFSK